MEINLKLTSKESKEFSKLNYLTQKYEHIVSFCLEHIYDIPKEKIISYVEQNTETLAQQKRFLLFVLKKYLKSDYKPEYYSYQFKNFQLDLNQVTVVITQKGED